MKKIIVSIITLVMILTSCEYKDMMNNPGASTGGTETATLEQESKNEPSSDDTESSLISTDEITTEPIASSETEQPDSNEDKIAGTYFCSSVYFEDEFFIRNPECVSWIAFYEDSNCVFHINYLEGICDVNGTYQIEGSNINVELDLSGTPVDGTYVHNDKEYRYMDYKYVFKIIDNNHITIGPAPDSFDGGDCYAVHNGDSFIRK